MLPDLARRLTLVSLLVAAFSYPPGAPIVFGILLVALLVVRSARLPRGRGPVPERAGHAGSGEEDVPYQIDAVALDPVPVPEQQRVLGDRPPRRRRARKPPPAHPKRRRQPPGQRSRVQSVVLTARNTHETGVEGREEKSRQRAEGE